MREEKKFLDKLLRFHDYRRWRKMEMKNRKSFLLVNDERLSCEIGNVKGGQKSGWSRVEWDGI